MKPTQITDLFANIKATFVSFFSILMFVALGVGVFLGIYWVAPALQNASDAKFDEGDLHNFQILFTYGLTDDDLAKLAEVEGVSDIEAGYQSFQTLVRDNTRRTVKVQTIFERTDLLTVMEGELPAKPDEIALNKEAAERIGIGVGDAITFEKDPDDDTESLLSDDPDSPNKSTTSSDGMKFLNGATYKVTALVHSPEYLAVSDETYGFSTSIPGTIDMIAWVQPAAFNAAAFQNGYPIVNVRCDSLQGMNSFLGDYKQQSNVIKGRITELGAELANKRYDDLHGKMQQEIDKYQAQLDDAKRMIAEGEEQIAEAEQMIADGRATLESMRVQGKAELDAAYQTLLGLQAEYDEYLATYNAIRSTYDSAVAEIEGAKAEIDGLAAQARQLEEDRKSGKITEEEYRQGCRDLAAQANSKLDPARQYIPGLPAIDENNVTGKLIEASSSLSDYRNIHVAVSGQEISLNEAEQMLDETKAELDSKGADLQYAWGQYYTKQAEYESAIAQGEATIAGYEQELANHRQELEDGKRQVAENEPKLQQARDQLAEMQQYSWTVAARNDNIGMANVNVFCDVTSNLALSMAALFVIVGLLVSYSAVSRIVHEQITQIGTKKALGLRESEIAFGFLAYSGLAVIAGAIIGSIVGYTLVEGIIAQALGGMFILGAYPPYFDMLMFLIITLFELVLVLGATWFACHSIMRKHAVELLRGAQPPEGKTRFYEKWAIWEHLPLLTQTIVNNCMNDKRRVFSTIVGVAGCTALIVTAITLNNNVLKSFDKHYADVYGFSYITFIDNKVEGAFENAEKALESDGSSTAQVLRKSCALELPGGSLASVFMIVPADAETFSQIYHIHPVKGAEFDPSAEGVWVSQAYMEHFDAHVGDMAKVDVGDGTVHEMPILGFCEFWLTYHEVIIGRDYYEREFNTQYAPNALFSTTGFNDTGSAFSNAAANDGSSGSSAGSTTLANTTAALSKVDGFDSVKDDKQYQSLNFKRFASVSSAVVLVYIALSALMAMVVLLNLNIMFVSEKKRELIVLMINGFGLKDAKRYIYNDTIVLTAIGIIVGVVFGCIMGSITVISVEPSTASFVKSIDWVAVAAGVVGSAILSIIMSIVALRRIPKFNLTDIGRQ